MERLAEPLDRLTGDLGDEFEVLVHMEHGELRQFCRGGLPHAILFEAALAGENFRKLRNEWCLEVPALAFIEIAEDGRALEVHDIGGQRTSRIGRDVLASALPSALMFELAKAG